MLFRHQNDSSTSNLHQMFCEIKNVRLSSRWLPLRMIYDAPELKPSQTPKENKFPTGHAFEIILPNLIQKSKKRNLK